MRLTKNFVLDEFLYSDFYDAEQQQRVIESFIDNESELLTNITELAKNLQVLRDYLKRPIHINIAYRPKWYELLKGRSGGSKHVLGMAADIRVKGLSTSKVRAAIEYLISIGKMKQGGIGKYNSFVHYDIFFDGINARRW